MQRILVALLLGLVSSTVQVQLDAQGNDGRGLVTMILEKTISPQVRI